MQSSRHMETFTIRLECVYHLIKEFAGTIQVAGQGIAAPGPEKKERDQRKSGEWIREPPLCDNFLIPDIWYAFDFLAQNSLLSSLLPLRPLPPVALRNCSEVSSSNSGHREMTSPSRAPSTAQSVSVRTGAKDNLCLWATCNRCAHSTIEERARGSRLTTIGRVVQSKTPWTRDALCSVATSPGRVCVLHCERFMGLCWPRVIDCAAHERKARKCTEIDDKND